MTKNEYIAANAAALIELIEEAKSSTSSNHDMAIVEALAAFIPADVTETDSQFRPIDFTFPILEGN